MLCVQRQAHHSDLHNDAWTDKKCSNSLRSDRDQHVAISCYRNNGLNALEQNDERRGMIGQVTQKDQQASGEAAFSCCANCYDGLRSHISIRQQNSFRARRQNTS